MWTPFKRQDFQRPYQGKKALNETHLRKCGVGVKNLNLEGHLVYFM